MFKLRKMGQVVFFVTSLLGLFVPLAYPIDGKMRAHLTGYENATVEFSRNSVSLSDLKKNDIEEAVKKARERGKILKVELAVWSDNPMPERGHKLPRTDVKLADQRTRSVINILREFGVSKIKTFNMARPPSRFAQLLKTESGELKGILSKHAGEGPIPEKYFDIQRHGAPSKAVLVLVIQEKMEEK